MARKFLAAVLAVAVVFGGGLSSAVDVSFDAAVSVSAETLVSGNYKYVILDDGTVEIAGYSGSSTTVTIPSEIDGKKVTSIGDKAFAYEYTPETAIYNKITSVTIPNGVTNIGEYAFKECRKLKSITIPDSVTNIGEGAFSVCIVLTSVTIPDGVTSIEAFTFLGCVFLTNVSIPNSVKNIGPSAFKECSNLKKLTIPDSVTSIGDYAFYTCNSMSAITIPASVEDIGEKTFGYFYGTRPVYEAQRDDTTIYCYRGTTGEQYAIDNNFVYIGEKDGKLVYYYTNSGELPDIDDSSSSESDEDSSSQTDAGLSRPDDSPSMPDDSSSKPDDSSSQPDDSSSSIPDDSSSKPDDSSSKPDDSKPDTPKKGDINGDNVINISDLTAITAHAKGIAKLTDLSAADVNGDGVVNIMDVTKVAAHVKGIETLG